MMNSTSICVFFLIVVIGLASADRIVSKAEHDTIKRIWKSDCYQNHLALNDFISCGRLYEQRSDAPFGYKAKHVSQLLIY